METNEREQLMFELKEMRSKALFYAEERNYLFRDLKDFAEELTRIAADYKIANTYEGYKIDALSVYYDIIGRFKVYIKEIDTVNKELIENDLKTLKEECRKDINERNLSS